MGADAVALVLASAFLHAFWNARTHAGPERALVLAVAYASGTVLLSPWLFADPPTEALGFMAMSGLAHGGYITFLARAYDRGGLATTYPVARGAAPLLVAVVAVWLLDQTPSATTVVGAVIVAIGLAVIGGVAWGKGERSALVMALVTAGCIASYTLLDARGVEETGELGYFAGASAVAMLVAVALQRPGVARVRASLRPGVVVGLFSTASYGLILLAYTRADAANIATLRGTSILMGLALVPRTVTPRLAAGATAVVVGAVLVTI